MYIYICYMYICIRYIYIYVIYLYINKPIRIGTVPFAIHFLIAPAANLLSFREMQFPEREIGRQIWMTRKKAVMGEAYFPSLASKQNQSMTIV